MKIIFLENRYKTSFWLAVAQQMRLRGHQVGWLVQNAQFCPDNEAVRCIPYPTGRSSGLRMQSDLMDGVARTDRHILYFHGDNNHYGYYAEKIDEYLADLSPDLLIGESTMFHELMAIRWSRKHGVPYLHPTSPGYPTGRFVVYEGDTKTPVGGCGELLTDEACDHLVDAIVNRKIVPDYMKRVSIQAADAKKSWPKPGSLGARVAMLRSYIRGERFNTPSPWRKVMLDASRRRFLREWQEMAEGPEEILGTGNAVLYPLQMQPEANLDVWGNRYRDQAKLIRDIAAELPPGKRLLVKANPKANLEVSADLLQSLRSDSKIVVLPLDMPMGQILPHVQAVVTVTGTIAIECVLIGKPVLVLGPSVVSGFAGAVDASHGENLADCLRKLFSTVVSVTNPSGRRDLIRHLHATTYPGLVSDPCYVPDCVKPENARLIADGLLMSLGPGR